MASVTNRADNSRRVVVCRVGPWIGGRSAPTPAEGAPSGESRAPRANALKHLAAHGGRPYTGTHPMEHAGWLPVRPSVPSKAEPHGARRCRCRQSVAGVAAVGAIPTRAGFESRRRARSGRPGPTRSRPLHNCNFMRMLGTAESSAPSGPKSEQSTPAECEVPLLDSPGYFPYDEGRDTRTHVPQARRVIP